jgi:hypothetical protein
LADVDSQRMVAELYQLCFQPQQFGFNPEANSPIFGRAELEISQKQLCFLASSAHHSVFWMDVYTVCISNGKSVLYFSPVYKYRPYLDFKHLL